MPDVADRIRSFISETFLVTFTNGVNDETDLFEEGAIDSFGFVELVAFLSRMYDVEITEDDLASPDLASVAGMARLMAERRRVG